MIAALQPNTWAQPVTLPWALLISALWYLQRYTPVTRPYHWAWAHARRA